MSPATFQRVPETTLNYLRKLQSVTPTASDVLDELGFNLAVSADVLRPRQLGSTVAGQVVTIRYMAERRSSSHAELRLSMSRLAHHLLFAMAKPGDIAVFDVHGVEGISVMGGIGALSAKKAGIAACIVDGGVRDLAEIHSMGIPCWSRSLTPRTGKWRLEAVAINEAVMCAGVQVHPGDLAVADDSGVCFLPLEVAEVAARRVLDVAAKEADQLRQKEARTVKPAQRKR
jgi:4-hydroxy-4-methyl-2-oxoglutarate aldolase